MYQLHTQEDLNLQYTVFKYCEELVEILNRKHDTTYGNYLVVETDRYYDILCPPSSIGLSHIPSSDRSNWARVRKNNGFVHYNGATKPHQVRYKLLDDTSRSVLFENADQFGECMYSIEAKRLHKKKKAGISTKPKTKRQKH